MGVVRHFGGRTPALPLRNRREIQLFGISLNLVEDFSVRSRNRLVSNKRLLCRTEKAGNEESRAE